MFPILGVLIFLLLAGPLLVPIPPPRNVRPLEELVDPDSRFLDWEGTRIHYKVDGQGEPTLLLLHGSAASVFSWRDVMPPLAGQGRVAAFDRTGFGLSERPLPGEWQGPSPYSQEAHVQQTIALLDHLGAAEAVLVGHSAGGAVAVLMALEHPERVEALVLIAPYVYQTDRQAEWLTALLATPQARRLGPLFLRLFLGRAQSVIDLAWHDPPALTDEAIQGYLKSFQVENWDQGLWEIVVAHETLDLPAQLDRLNLPVLVITGGDDRIVPTEDSIRLAGELPDAELVVIPDCGHVATDECPGQVVAAIQAFLKDRSIEP